MYSISPTRKSICLIAGAFSLALLLMLTVTVAAIAQDSDSLDAAQVVEALPFAEKLIGLEFTPAERDSMADFLAERAIQFRQIREFPLPNDLGPATIYRPVPADWIAPSGGVAPTERKRLMGLAGKSIKRPQRDSDLAFMTVPELGQLIQAGEISSLELTRLYLSRLKQYDSKLFCVITLTEELALEQARRADEEIAGGNYRGPLHGIPYGLKDLFTVSGYPTTWGAKPFRDQMLTENATVYERLHEAGAVLVAKLTTGALAWGDVWYGETTRNPWDVEKGSSGSSAGPASATAAGLVGFAIGTETYGSIVSPCTRCGVCGLRPSFGRVSRHGAMALSWTMDKIGPICRSATGCELVYAAIAGVDQLDPTLIEAPLFTKPDSPIGGMRVGYAAALFEDDYPSRETDQKTLALLRELGCELIPITLPEYPFDAISLVLESEAAAAFDDLTRSGRDDELVRQIQWAWPNVFRAARLIPAVEYIQANRIRTALNREMNALMATVDLYVAPSFGGRNLLMTNLTGHPCMVVPNGFNDDGKPVSISFIGGMFEEATLLSAVKQYQAASDWHRRRPPGMDE
jgi:Asp-tRNA(Asn)/Glu-tRNA(Gln) amidotransferase A subunit family amidase